MSDEKFDNLTRGEIARKFITPEQNKLLSDFFGAGALGAKQRLDDFKIPNGLTRGALEAYREIARQTINAELDKHKVQTLRLQLIEKALAEIKD